MNTRNLVGMLAYVCGACGPVVRPDGGKGLLPVGAMAPELVGTAPNGTVTRLSESRGHAAVVYFYPMDGTPGCTKEACAFRDAFDAYDALHVTVFGVSRDSSKSHADFRAKHALPFSLVSDQDGTIAHAYGVKSTFGMASRVTFLVGADGRIAHVWPDVDPALHAKEVLAVVRSTHQNEPSSPALDGPI